MKAVVAAFNQEKALVGAFSVITNLRMELLEALDNIHPLFCVWCDPIHHWHTDIATIATTLGEKQLLPTFFLHSNHCYVITFHHRKDTVLWSHINIEPNTQ